MSVEEYEVGKIYEKGDILLIAKPISYASEIETRFVYGHITSESLSQLPVVPDTEPYLAVVAGATKTDYVVLFMCVNESTHFGTLPIEMPSIIWTYNTILSMPIAWLNHHTHAFLTKPRKLFDFLWR